VDVFDEPHRGGAARQPFGARVPRGHYGMENMLNAARRPNARAAAK
jgi:hypothetical protein